MQLQKSLNAPMACFEALTSLLLDWWERFSPLRYAQPKCQLETARAHSPCPFPFLAFSLLEVLPPECKLSCNPKKVALEKMLSTLCHFLNIYEFFNIFHLIPLRPTSPTACQPPQCCCPNTASAGDASADFPSSDFASNSPVSSAWWYLMLALQNCLTVSGAPKHFPQ